MALTDPELDLLRELLEDDPTDEAFLQVGEELVRRGVWAEAEAILSAGLAAHPNERKGWALLARAALECAHFDVSLAALGRVDTDPARQPHNAQLEILALERAGRLSDAAARIEAYLAVDPHDVVVGAARERLEAPPPENTRRASDPFVNVERAEQYVAIGRPDRAVRVYRRILFHNPGDNALLARLRQLSAEGEWRQDDLSEELTDPGATPPDLEMPQPRLTAIPSDNEITDAREMPVSVREYVAGPPQAPPEPPSDPDEEDTDLHPLRADGTIARVAQKGSRKRRRSLINR